MAPCSASALRWVLGATALISSLSAVSAIAPPPPPIPPIILPLPPGVVAPPPPPNNCPRGYMQEYRATACNDINECTITPYKRRCERINAECRNTNGSFQCVCRRSAGYRSNGRICVPAPKPAPVVTPVPQPLPAPGSCPSQLPSNFAPCAANGQKCDYRQCSDCDCDGVETCGTVTAVCANNQWAAPVFDVCPPCPTRPTTAPTLTPTTTPLPPPGSCPARMPGNFDRCTTNGQKCDYKTCNDCDCDGVETCDNITAICANGQWSAPTFDACPPCPPRPAATGAKNCGQFTNGTIIPGDASYLTDDECFMCFCSSQDGKLTCAGWTCVKPPMTCTTSTGQKVAEGASVPKDGDKCGNVCTCMGGSLVCTVTPCVAPLPPPGSCPARLPGNFDTCTTNGQKCDYKTCNDCDCDGVETCGNITATCTNGQWSAPVFDACPPCPPRPTGGSCGTFANGSAILNGTTYPSADGCFTCSCLNGQQSCGGTGCVTPPSVPAPPTCTTSTGQKVAEGASVPKDGDKCGNVCTCMGGALVCTVTPCVVPPVPLPVPAPGSCPTQLPGNFDTCITNGQKCDYRQCSDCDCDGVETCGTVTAVCANGQWAAPVFDVCPPCTTRTMRTQYKE